MTTFLLRFGSFLLLSYSLLAAGAGCKERAQDPSWPPNLVLISLDTLRADHLGCHGYSRVTSPNIDALASTANLFLNAFSTAPKTPESHMSMFTSLYPTTHGIGVIRHEDADRAEIPVLSPQIQTLAGILRERGYATVGFHSGGFVAPKFGFDRGFDVYEESKLSKALEWLERNANDGPFFLFYHTYHVHDPYTPRPPFDSMFDQGYAGRIVHDLGRLKELGGTDWHDYHDVFWSLVDKNSPADVERLKALYDGEIAEVDRDVRRLFDAIERHAPNTLLVLVSDHGEEFGDHGQFIHEQIYDELLRVPLVIKLPGQTKGRIVEQPVSLIDLAPTLLHVLSVPPIEQFQGRIRPWFGDVPGSAEHETGVRTVAATSADTQSQADPDEMYSELPNFGHAAVRDARWKLLSTSKGLELYDYRDDPRETNNLLPGPAARDGAVADAFERLNSRLQAWQTQNRELHEQYYANRETERLDPKNLEQLRALGYVD